MGSQRIGDPFAAFDDDAGIARPAIAHADLASRRWRAGGDRAAVDGDRWKFLARPVVDVDLTAALDRAQAIGTGRQGGADGSLLPRRQDLLHDDMRRRMRSVEAIFADRQLAHGGRRLEAELDIAREIGVVCDVARRAMRRLGQLIERGDRTLGAAAARAEQIPANPEEAGARRLQEELDDVARLDRPFARQPQRPHAREVDLRRGEEMLAEPRRQPMPIGAALDLRGAGGDPRDGALGQRGRRIVEELRPPAGEKLGGHLDQPADRGAALFEKA